MEVRPVLVGPVYKNLHSQVLVFSPFSRPNAETRRVLNAHGATCVAVGRAVHAPGPLELTAREKHGQQTRRELGAHLEQHLASLTSTKSEVRSLRGRAEMRRTPEQVVVRFQG